MTGEMVISASGLRKAAILMVILGEEPASALCKQLPPTVLPSLIQEIIALGPVSPEEAAHVLDEYNALITGQTVSAQGGTDYVNNLLVRAFGEDRAKEVLAHATSTFEDSATFDWLQKADPQQLLKFMEGEHPQTIALILAHLGAKAAPALMLLPEKVRTESMKRLASLHQFSPDTVRKILVVLDQKLKMLGEQNRCVYGGARAVADLLNRLDAASSQTILESIEQEDPKQALEIRNLMFTFENLVTIPESGIRELLSQLDKKTLALALKGSSEEMKNHIFKCMSLRAVEMLKEDMDALGPVRVREAERAKQETVVLARKLESDGRLTLKSEGDEYVV